MIKFSKFIFFCTFIIYSFAKKINDDNICRILALEGGGDRGAYQAGVIKGLVNLLPGNIIDWDVVSGISAGTLNSLGLAIYPKGQEKEASQFINDVWLELQGKNSILGEICPIPFIGKYIGPVWGAFNGQSLYNNKPLRALLEKKLSGRKIERSYNFGATSIRTGEYLRFTNLKPDQLVDAVLSSSAVPGIFPPIHYKNETFVDGGLSYFFDLTTPIQTCLKQGFLEENIEIDLVLCGSGDIEPIVDSDFYTLDIVLQTFNILSANFKFRDLLYALGTFPKIKIRYMIEPSEKISSFLPLNFDPKDIRNSIRVGEKDAKAAIEQGEGVYFRKVMSEYKAKLKKELKVLEDY